MNRRPRTAWGAFLMVGMLLLPGCGIFKLVESEPGFIGFEDQPAGESPTQWEMDSSVIYTLTLDSEVRHSGLQSLRLRHAGLDDPEIPKVDDDQAMATHCPDPAPFLGSKFVRLSAALRVEGGTASMWLRGPTDPATLAYGPPHVETGDIGPEDWTQHRLVATKRQEQPLCIHLVLKGVGTLWADDLSIERLDVGDDSSEKFRPIALPNLDMEIADKQGRLAHWVLQEPVEPGLELRADSEVKRSGSFSARLDDPDDPEAGPGLGDDGVPSGAEYCADPAPFEGNAVRVSFWVRVADVRPTNQVFLFLQAFGGLSDPSTLHSRVFREDIRPTHDWTQHDLIASVPTGVTEVCFGFDVFSGTVFVDDVSVEIIEL